MLASSDSMCPKPDISPRPPSSDSLCFVSDQEQISSVFSALNFKRFVAANVGDAASSRVEVEAVWPRLQCISL